MASLETALVRKVKKALTHEFPPPAMIRLYDDDGVIGVVASDQFVGIDTIDRQDRIGEILDTTLTMAERRRIQAIVGVTLLEEAGFRASKARPARVRTASRR